LVAGDLKRRAKLIVRRVGFRIHPRLIDFGPMNRQPKRQQVVRDLLAAHPVTAVFETGTYLGSTALFMREASGVAVYSVEAEQRHFDYASKRVAAQEEIHLTLGDCREGIRTWAADPAIPKDNVIFYLDAHWEKDLPVADELGLIAGHWTNALVLIDDFEVPGDSRYGFEDYGAGMALTLDCIPAEARNRWTALFPTAPGSDEGGFRRGWVVLAPPERAEVLANELPLKIVPWP